MLPNLGKDYTVKLYDGLGNEIESIIVFATDSELAVKRARRQLENHKPEMVRQAYRWDAAVKRD